MALIFCLGNQPIDLNEVVKSSTIIAFALYFSFNSINVLLHTCRCYVWVYKYAQRKNFWMD